MTLIAFVGPRASGKTAVGKSLSSILKYKFVDFDEYMTNYLERKGFAGISSNKDSYVSYLMKSGMKMQYAWQEYHAVHNDELMKFIRKNKGKNIVLAIGGTTIGKTKNYFLLFNFFTESCNDFTLSVNVGRTFSKTLLSALSSTLTSFIELL